MRPNCGWYIFFSFCQSLFCNCSSRIRFERQPESFVTKIVFFPRHLICKDRGVALVGKVCLSGLYNQPRWVDFIGAITYFKKYTLAMEEQPTLNAFK